MIVHRKTALDSNSVCQTRKIHSDAAVNTDRDDHCNSAAFGREGACPLTEIHGLGRRP
jgi:hypothetical protein